MIRSSRILPLALLLLATSTLLGCEEDLPTREHFEIPFSMYGVLSPQLPLQSIRLYATEDFPTLSADSIDAVVTSTDLTTGETRTWKDSVVVAVNGQYEHVFWSPFRAEYGHRYHVEATRPSDGARTFVEALVPPQVAVKVDQSQSPDIYVSFEGEALRMLKPEALYVVQKPPDNERSFYPILSYPKTYGGKPQQVPNGWMVHIRMHFDRDSVTSWYVLDADAKKDRTRYCPQLILHDLRFRALVGESVWHPPGGVFDRNVLSHPKAMSNVQNGFGFVGAGYRIDVSLNLTPEAIEKACFYSHDPMQ